jgi:PAS domain-containing protein
LGQVRWLRDMVRPVTDPSTGQVVKLMGGVQDITERKRLEEQLLQVEKLAAVARLSGGVAHDFNNLLSVVMGSVELLEQEVQSDRGRESCAAIVEAASRGAELTSSLLAFARKEVGSPQLVDLTRVVADALPGRGPEGGRALFGRADLEPGPHRPGPGPADALEPRGQRQSCDARWRVDLHQHQRWADGGERGAARRALGWAVGALVGR